MSDNRNVPDGLMRTGVGLLTLVLTVGLIFLVARKPAPPPPAGKPQGIWFYLVKWWVNRSQ